MKEKTITCVVCGTDLSNTKIKKIPNELKQFQNLVGGQIEITTPLELSTSGIKMLVNENGLNEGLKPNENLFPFFYVGNVVFISTDGEEVASLTTKQIEILLKWLVSLQLI